MIVKIDSEFLKGNGKELDDKVFELCKIIEFGHYVDVERSILGDFLDIIKKHANNSKFSLVSGAIEKFDKEKSLRFTLTTIRFSDYSERRRKVLLLKESELLVENAPNEWSIYKNLVTYYTKEPTIKNVAKYLNRAIKERMLKSENLGGANMIPDMLKHKNKEEFDDLYKMKVCVLFDRDKENGTEIDINKKNVFKALCNGIDINQVNNDLIYRLDYEDEYVWHMWYKRAIENYFPREKYEELGVDMDSFKDDLPYDYKKFGNNTPKGYKKDMMKSISDDMKYTYFEDTTEHFDINDKRMSEIQLLLLKIAKIV